MPYGYTIKHLPSGKIYRGVVIATSRMPCDRFKDHMKCVGSKIIAAVLKESPNGASDFLLEDEIYFDVAEDAYDWERRTIASDWAVSKPNSMNIAPGGNGYDGMQHANPTSHPNWKRGRENYTNRIRDCGLTEKELQQKVALKILISDHWQKQDTEYIKNRTSPGMAVRNAKMHSCKYCGKGDLTLGNLKRWHDEQCKHR